MKTIEFTKITDPRDIEVWIAENAYDAKLSTLEYHLAMAQIGEDWRNHKIVDDGLGYTLKFSEGYVLVMGAQPMPTPAFLATFKLGSNCEREGRILFTCTDDDEIMKVTRILPDATFILSTTAEGAH